jgi:uncharacterized protein YggE
MPPSDSGNSDQEETMKRFCLALLIAAGLASPAIAQTTLNLSANATVLAPPDEMTASLTVQANAGSAAAAQGKVNMLMGKALAEARATAGITATTAEYSVQDTSEKQNGTAFQASQSLTLTMPAPGTTPPAAFTALLGQLQAQNLQLNNLAGDLSAAGRQQAANQAITAAIGQVQAQAAMVAKTLGEKVQSIKTLNINADGPGPVTPMRMMAMAAPQAAPPQAAPGPVAINANVNAEILLGP